MREHVITAVIAALVGGAAGSLLTRAWPAPPKPTPTRAVAEARAGAASDNDDVRERVETLERAVAGLDRDRRARVVARAMDDGTPAASAAARTSVDDPVFEAAVRDVLDQIASEKSSAREVERAERRAQRAHRYAERLATDLGLSAESQRRVAELMQRHVDTLRSLRDADGGTGNDREAWRATRDEQVKKTEEQLAALLSAEELARYKALPEEQRVGAVRSGGDRGERGNSGRGGGRRGDP